jgi:hypothetical protein
MDNKTPSKKDTETRGFFSRIFNTLIGIGLGESMLRTGTTLLSVVLLGVVIWLLRIFYAQAPEAGKTANALQTGPTAPVARIEAALSPSAISFGGIPRLAQVHTTLPSRPRADVIK